VNANVPFKYIHEYYDETAPCDGNFIFVR